MKNRFLFSLLLLFGLLSAATASADTSTRGCETNTMKAGTFCNWAEGKSWCTNNTNTCAVESTTACPVNPTGGTYAFSCNINACVLSCDTGYTNCTGTCKLNVAVPSNCTTFNQCTEVCSACAQGYELSGGVCVGATLKLGSDSVGVSNYIFQTATPVLTIPSTGNVGIGTTTPMAKLEIVPTSGYSILAGNFKIGNVGLPTADGDVTTKGYVDSVISLATSSFASLWGGTAETDIWSLNSGNVGIGTTTPRAKLNIYAGAGHGLKINGFGTGDFYGIDFTSSGLSGGTDFLLYAASTMYIRADGYMSFPYLYASGYLRTATLYHTAAMTIYTNSGAITLGTASTTNIIMNPGGNVGIGTTTPLAKLSIVPATGYAILAGNYKIGNVALPTADGDAATKGYVDAAMSTGYLPLTGGTMAGAINMGNNNITNLNSLTVNKITATTIDPLYTIKGINYSTFAPSIAGGVKEEYTGKIGIYKLIATKEYEATIDFAAVKEGSDLWLWHQVVDYDKDSVDVAVTPYGRSAQVYYLVDGNKLIFRSDKAVEISYRLTAKRFDWRDWPTLSNDQTTRGLEIEY